MIMLDDAWVYDCETAGAALGTAAVAPSMLVWRRSLAADVSP
jgi:hypothetical protein